MVVAMKESGLKTTWKAWEFTFGTTAECTKVNTKMTKSMASEFTLGQIVDATKATGTKVNNMVSEHTSFPKTVRQSSAFGKMGKE